VIKARIIIGTAALLCALAVVGKARRAAAAGDDVSPADQYKVYCAKCHGPAGHGDGANASTLKTRPRDFSDCATMSKISDDIMFKAIKEGGAAVNLPGDMPPWGQAFEDGEIRGLVTYVRAFCKK
jgi:cytochrome c oxidase cbb3-type subunit 3